MRGPLERFDPTPIARIHFQAMRAPGASSLSRSTHFVLFYLPACLGAFGGTLVARGLPLADGVSQVLSATALLVGVMLSAFVFLTNLRVKIQESATYAFRSQLQKLVGGAAVGCLYVAGVAFITAGILSAAATLDFLRGPRVRPYTAGLIIAILAHLTVNLLTVFRRLFGTYFDLFASDFDPDFEARPVVSKRAQAKVERTERRSGR